MNPDRKTRKMKERYFMVMEGIGKKSSTDKKLKDASAQSVPEIRRMVSADLPEVERIEQENFSRPWTAEDYQGFLDREDADFLVAVVDGRIVGYIGEYGLPDEGDITNVSVDRRYRNRHIGTCLVSGLIQTAGARGIRKIFLEVRESNAPAIRLYENAGFRKTGVRRNYYTSPVEDAVLMMRGPETEKDEI